MLIDWFTVAAQAINFLILIWLMKRFLYRPILDAIDAREKRIADDTAAAAKLKADAEKESAELKKKNTDFDASRASLISAAENAAKAEGERLLEEARKAAAALSAKLQKASEDQEQALHEQVRVRMQSAVFDVARKALADLAGASLEERISELFAQRLRELDPAAKKALGDALKAQTNPAVVRSAFDLSADARGRVQKALNETFSADVHLRFETASALIGGIELSTTDSKLGWSIADYLSSVENAALALLKAQAKPAASPKPAEPKPAPNPAGKSS
jgi:F-type H+-transporting ATPase subunit b